MAKQRVIRVGAKGETGKVKSLVSRLTSQVKKFGVSRVATSLSQKGQAELIDFVHEKTAEKKELDARIKTARGILLEYARDKKEFEACGEKAKLITSATVERIYGTPTELVKMLKKENKIHIFDDVASVQITELKKYIGEEALIAHGFLEINTKEEIGKITIKKR